MLRTILISLIFLQGICESVKGQSEIPIRLSIYNESTSMPFSTWPAGPVHPGIQVGAEYPWKESDQYRLYPAINIGYLFHQKLFQGLYMNAEIGFDLKLKSGINLKAAVGTGYLRTFTTRQEYQFRNGSYYSKADKGNSRVMPSPATPFRN